MPSNVLIDDDGRAVLSDLAYSKWDYENGLEDQSATVTESPNSHKAMRFQAPELNEAARMLHGSDIWSWAMTSLAILTGSASLQLFIMLYQY